MALYFAVRAGVFLARVVPLRISYAIARVAGLLAFTVWPGGRRRCIQNMRHVTSGDLPEARRLARRSFGNYVVYLVDFFRLLSLDGSEVERRVEYDRTALWDTLRDQRRGNGIVFITMHFGNWDLGAALLALNEFPISAIADSFSNERVNRLVIGSREHLGMKIIQADRLGPGILRALRGDDVVAMLIDIPQRQGGVEVEFFGATIAVPDGPARIALRAGAPVVAATLPRVHPWSDRVGVTIAPVAFDPSGDTERDARDLTQAVFRHLEDQIRRDPSQWYIFRNLWVADRLPAAP
ncbi:MAG: lysophospholipid acyltransferase family protein [Chloroflexi bacterium]|nr:lysophospholipid acyltransferase family protein [Chloroflexota bacterium]MDA1240721.1 lysophospholipid acyltransferase family protein [Chloroflexota bacterium]